ncbi:MAG: ABC transporter permease subunit [Promethearchaeota archaeon]
MDVLTVQEFEIPESFKHKEQPPKDTKFVISLLLPALLIFVLVILFPIFIGIFISFRNASGGQYFGQQFTLSNYYELLFYGNYNTRDFWRYTYQTLFFSIVSLTLEFLLGLLFAILLNKSFKGRSIARATLLIPWAIPTVASATLYRFEILNSADQYGLINSLLILFGGRPVSFYGADAPTLFFLPCLVPYSPFVTDIPITLTMFSVIIIDVWKTTPFITLLILAALQIVPEDLYKAGEVAGASGWQKFRYITLPLIKPGIGVALLFRMMQALRVYDAVVVFNDVSVNSMTSHAVLLWLSGDYGLASAVSVMLLVFVGIFALVIVYFTRRETGTTEKSNSKLKNNDLEEKYDLKQEDKEESSDITQFKTEFKPISESKVKMFIIRRYLHKIIFALLVILMCLFCAVPFIWIVSRSFRDPYIVQTQFELFPAYPSLRAYQVIFVHAEVYGITFDRALLNSSILAGLTVIVVIVVGSFIAYAIAKFDFPFKSGLNSFIFSMNSLPPLIIIIPFYLQMIFIGTFLPPLDLRDNLLGLVLPYTAFNLPLAVFILVAFFHEIPEDLWKAAKVDGASNFQIFRKVILPLTIPGIFTCAILIFIASWNELLFAQIFLTSPAHHTVPRAILRYVRNPQSLTARWNTDIALMAATSISTVPLVIAVLIFQKKIISGLTRGAVKG